MSYTLVLGDVLRASAWMVDGGQAAVNTWHYHVDSVGTPAATDVDVAQILDTAIHGAYKALLNNNANYHGVIIQKIYPAPIPVAQGTNVHLGAGTAGATALPKQVSGLISLFTSLAKQRNRGRVYIGFPATADDTGDGTPIASYETRLATLAALIIAGGVFSTGGRSATLSTGIWHRDNNTITPVMQYAVQSGWATQRRRGAFGRGNIAPI